MCRIVLDGRRGQEVFQAFLFDLRLAGGSAYLGKDTLDLGTDFFFVRIRV